MFLQSPDGGPVVADDVSYIVVERGNWVMDGVAVEARKHTSTDTAHRGDWSKFESRTYGRAFVNPVVLGQVMSVNDPRFSTFWSRGSWRGATPSTTDLNVGKMAGEDPAPDRADGARRLPRWGKGEATASLRQGFS